MLYVQLWTIDLRHSLIVLQGYALFKSRDKKLLQNENLATEAESAEGVNEM